LQAHTLKKLIAACVILGIIAAYKIFGLDQYLTLSYAQNSREAFETLYSEHPGGVIAGYMAIYIFTTSLSLPTAAILTLAGGALFGFWRGTLIVSFASATGATLACFASRYLLRDWIQSAFGYKLRKINEGVKREGTFYLFTLRLVPIFPFPVINLAMGLTGMPLFKFYWASQLGMLPGTMVYVNAGRRLAGIRSLSEILSPGLIASFALLGIFPIAAKKFLNLYRTRMKKASGETNPSDKT